MQEERSRSLGIPSSEASSNEAVDQIVFLVDDDEIVRDAIVDLLASVGLTTIGFGSVSEYLAFERPDVPGCLVLDIELPDGNGLDFHSRIIGDNHPPAVFITGHGDVPSSVRAMKNGAVDFLIKPFRDDELVRAIKASIQQHRVRRADRFDMMDLQKRWESLTPRERQVLPLVVSGLLNKQAAAELSISEVTFQIHRGKVMQKMKAASLADLVRMAAKLDVQINHSRHTGASTQ